MPACCTFLRRHCAPTLALYVVYILFAAISGCGDNGGSSGSGRITYTVSGSANATSSGLQIELNSGNPIPIAANQGTWTFPEGLEVGATYNVSVTSNPQAETCSAQNDSGTIRQSNIVGVVIVCTPNHYTIGGTVTGFTGSGLVLEDTISGQKYTVTASGSFAITPGLTSGTNYNLIADTSKTSPLLNCTIPNGSGTAGDSNVTTIAVNCSVAPFNIGGSISGLKGSNLAITETVSGQTATPNVGDTSFFFPKQFLSGSKYSISIQSPTHTATGLTQNCTAVSPNGTVTTSNVNIAVTCVTQPYQLSGMVVLPAGQSNTPAGLVLTETISGIQATISAATPNPTGTGYLATFSFPFPATGNPAQSGLPDGTSFSIFIKELESTYVNSSLHCLIDGLGATGVIAGQNYSSVVVKCRPISSYLESAGPGVNPQSVSSVGSGARDCWGIDHVSGQVSIGTQGGLDGTVAFNPVALIAGASYSDPDYLNYGVSSPDSNFFFAYVDNLGNVNINRTSIVPDFQNIAPDCTDGEPTVISDPGFLSTPSALAFNPAGTGTVYAALGINSFAELDGTTGSGDGVISSSVKIAAGNNGNDTVFPPTSIQLDGSGNNALIFYVLPFAGLQSPTDGSYNGFTLVNRTGGSWAIADISAALSAGGFAPSGQPGWTAVSALVIGENIYVLSDNYADCQTTICYAEQPVSAPRIVGYSLNSSTGALSLLGGSPFQDANAAVDFGASLLNWCYDTTNLSLNSGHSCTSSAQNLIFLVNESAGIDVFQQTSTGSLTQLTPSPVTTNGVEGISSVVIDPSGKFLYAYALTTSNVAAYRINPSTSASSTQPLTFIGTYAVSGVNALSGANTLVIDNSGKFLYVLGTQLSGFRVDPNTGVLTPTAGSPYSPSLATETMLAVSTQ